MVTEKVQGGCDRKVPGGKLVRVRVEIEADPTPRLLSVKVYGDFFMHPETLIEDIESSLLESGMDSEGARLALRALFHGPDVNVFGAGPDDIAATSASAVEDALSKVPVSVRRS